MAILTNAQREAVEQGWRLAEAVELLTGYVMQQGYGREDEHLTGLLNLVSRARHDFEGGYEATYSEHEAAEDAQVAAAPNVVPLAGKIARRARKSVRQ